LTRFMRLFWPHRRRCAGPLPHVPRNVRAGKTAST
jgi:hypothetical protein